MIREFPVLVIHHQITLAFFKHMSTLLRSAILPPLVFCSFLSAWNSRHQIFSRKGSINSELFNHSARNLMHTKKAYYMLQFRKRQFPKLFVRDILMWLFEKFHSSQLLIQSAFHVTFSFCNFFQSKICNNTSRFKVTFAA